MWSNIEILPKKEDTPVDPCIAAAHSMLRQIKTKSNAQAQRPPQHERVSYIGPKSPYIEILKNWACTVNFQKNDILLMQQLKILVASKIKTVL